MTKEIDWNKLKEPFSENDIEWRIMQSGKGAKGIWAKCLAYVTNRAIMDRLDELVGIERWANEYKEGPGGGVICGISIFIKSETHPDGVWITKWDGAENTAVEAIKGGLSGAMKRAAVQWGIGRYLYHLEEGWADIKDNGKFRATLKDKTPFKWNPPSLPSWALPKGEKTEKPEPKTEPKQEDDPGPPSYDEMIAKIKEAKGLKHLSNIWEKYNGWFKGEEKSKLIMAKDERKVELTEGGK